MRNTAGFRLVINEVSLFCVLCALKNILLIQLINLKRLEPKYKVYFNAEKSYKIAYVIIPEYFPQQSCTNICFWYIPPRLRNQTEDDDWWKEVSEVAPKIKERMTMQGTMMIGFTPLPSKNFVNFFRLVLSNSMLVKADMDFVVAEIQRLGHDL